MIIEFRVIRPVREGTVFGARFQCERCGPTNHVVEGPAGFVCCACEPAMARALSRDRLTS